MNYTLKVKEAQSDDVERGFIRLHKDERDGADRFDVVRLKTGNEELMAIVLPHNEKGTIWINTDGRNDLGVKVSDIREFTISKLNWWGRIKWYCTAKDPAIHVPAWLAVISLGLGALGAILGIIGVILGAISLWQ
ncbi:hypothetical protein KCX83_21315 [Brucella oryzae]|uniref:hypothetical protein n=1 Tax=Brucella oryzae TaxID=335286 RepID=UPI001B82C070|nr:hypothetical protein [Brucella oryzae]MBR7654833.1 hypothetical protein [Brucella oryzae]